MRIMIINGPEARLLGKEKVKNSGNDTLDDIKIRVEEKAEEYEHDVAFEESGDEGQIVNHLYRAIEEYDGVILNIGGYAYSSYVIAEIIKAMNIPVIEVCPQKNPVTVGKESLISPYCEGRIIGLGSVVYTLALEAFLEI